MEKCIYAILDCNKDLDLDLKGLEGLPVYTIAYKDISAAVSDIEKDKLKVDKECASLYGSIIETIVKRYTLLPMRFGTMVKEDKDVTRILEKYYDGFAANLRQVKDKIEYGLKVLWDAEKANREIRREGRIENSRGIDQLKGDSPYKKYLLGKLKEHKLEEALLKRAEDIVEDVHNPLKGLSSLSKFKKMLTQRIVLDAAYLVEKEKRNAFIDKFKELKKERQDLKFLLTGPWPPYNFVNPVR